jgi:hypothetical protein
MYYLLKHTKENAMSLPIENCEKCRVLLWLESTIRVQSIYACLPNISLQCFVGRCRGEAEVNPALA